MVRKTTQQAQQKHQCSFEMNVAQQQVNICPLSSFTSRLQMHSLI
jgi:hypothetical protein